MVLPDSEVRPASEKTPFLETLTQGQQMFLWRGLAAIRGQYEQDPSFENAQVQTAHFLEIATLMHFLGFQIPISEAEKTKIKVIWDTSDKSWRDMPHSAHQLGIELEPIDSLIHISSKDLGAARNSTDEDKPDIIAGAHIELRFLGVETLVTPRDIQLIDRRIISYSNGDAQKIRKLSDLATNAKLLGMDVQLSTKDWKTMKADIFRILSSDYKYDDLFWFANGLVNLAVIDSPQPRIENGRLVLQ